MKISEEGCRVVDDVRSVMGKEKLQDTDGKKYELPAGKLKLKIDGPFLNLIGTMLAWGRDAPAYSDYTFKRKYDELEAAQNQYEGKKERRRRPKRVPGQALYVGDKKFDRTDDQKVCAKFLYNRQCIECVIIKSEISRKVTIPFGDITSLTLQLDRASVDVLNIEVKTSLRSFCAPGTAKPLKRSHLVWTADYNVDDSNSFPESRYFCLEVEKGTLERSFAKLVYSYPKLLRVLRIYQGSAHVDGSPPTPMFPPSPLLPDNNSSDGDKESTKSL